MKNVSREGFWSYLSFFLRLKIFSKLWIFRRHNWKVALFIYGGHQMIHTAIDYLKSIGGPLVEAKRSKEFRWKPFAEDKRTFQQWKWNMVERYWELWFKPHLFHTVSTLTEIMGTCSWINSLEVAKTRWWTNNTWRELLELFFNS